MAILKRVHEDTDLSKHDWLVVVDGRFSDQYAQVEEVTSLLQPC